MFAAVFKIETLDPDANTGVKALKTRCNDCLWRGTDGITCDAFPKGIPVEILTGAYDHIAPYNVTGVDDGGLQYIQDPMPDL